MSEFHVNVVRLGRLDPHPSADSLDITRVFDYPVITKRGTWQEGDLVVYVPIDSLVPDTEEWHWLSPLNDDGSPRFPVGRVPEKYRVIQAKRLRGIFSQGVLAPVPQGTYAIGDDVAAAMGITKYEPPLQVDTGGETEASPKGWTFPTYTDIEGLKRFPDVLRVGEEVVITEKIHGANARYVHDGERLWVGSHGQIKRQDPTNLWWVTAERESLERKLALAPFKIFFGEVYGCVQDLKYGIKSGARFRAFDVYDVKEMRYLDYAQAKMLADHVGIDWVPVLYVGPWNSELKKLCEGSSTLADNVREGFVVRPVCERWDDRIGRVILKQHGEAYLLRKKK